MQGRIAPLETHYNGYRFRSRLEARWAVFYDALGVPYRYEPEGFETPDGPYLPDFWLPEQGCWVEIKAREPSGDEQRRMAHVAESTGHRGFIFFGNIPVIVRRDRWRFVENEYDESAYRIDEGWDVSYLWCECPRCGCVGIQFEGRADRLPCKAQKCPGDGARRDRGHNADSSRLEAAYVAARSARFEHGEKPHAR